MYIHNMNKNLKRILGITFEAFSDLFSEYNGRH